MKVLSSISEDFTNRFPTYVDRYETLLTDNRIWKRLYCEHWRREPRARAGGFHGGDGSRFWHCGDLRKKQPYEVYDRMDFDIPVGVNGDCYDRYLVRVQEMRESNKIIKQCIAWLQANPGQSSPTTIR